MVTRSQVLVLVLSVVAASCRPERRLPDVPTVRVPAVEPIVLDSLARLEERIRAEHWPADPVRLGGLTLLAIRPARTYLDSAGTIAMREDVEDFEAAWPRIRAMAQEANFRTTLRDAPALVIDPRTGRTYTPPLPAGQVGYLLLAPGVRPLVLEGIVPEFLAPRCAAELRRPHGQPKLMSRRAA